MALVGKLAASLIEAACLTALIVVPLFFDPLSVRVFEPEKAAILRSLAVVVIVFGGVGVLAETRRDETRTRWLVPAWRCAGWRPLALAVACFVVATGLATACSVVPRVSFWGSYVRLQGAYTTLAYVALFVGLVATIRRRAQVERVVLATILASLPVSLYAVLQRLGMDPQSWGSDPSVRVTSTLGNPIFLGGYLVMIFPLTLDAAATALGAPTRWWVRGPAALLYLGIAGVQLLALGMSASRGPAVAWLVAMTFLLTVRCLVLGRRRLALAVLAVALLGGGAVGAAQIGGVGPRAAPFGLGRFGTLLDPGTASSRVRMLVWESVARLTAPHAPLVFADGREDRLNAIRPLVGYGPESLFFTFGRFYPAELAQVEDRDRLADRSHDEIWDMLAGGGLLGLAAYLGLMLAVFHLAFVRLGLVAGRRDARRLVLLCALGAALVPLALGVLAGAAFLGPAIAIGLVCGLFAHLGLAAAVGAAAPPAPVGRLGDRSLAAALAAAVLAHFVETQVGIATVTSRLCFWTLVALLVVAGRTESSPAAHRDEPWIRGALAWGFLVALVLGTLVYALVPNAGGAVEPGAIIREAMLGGVGVLLVTSWVASGLAAALAAGRRGSWAGSAGFLAVLLVVAGAGAWLFLDRHAHALAILARAAPRNLEEVGIGAVRLEELLARYHLFALALLLLLGLALWDVGPRPWRGLVLPALALVGVALPVAYATNLQPLRADVALKSAERLAAGGHWLEATAFYRRAVRLAPDEAQYWSRAASGLHEQAKQAAGRRDELMEEALADAREAELREPLHAGHVANLGRLYLWWASVTADPGLRAARAAKADEYLARAVEQMPNHARVWTERAALHLRVLERDESGLAYARRAVELDPRYGAPHQLLGDFYARVAARQAPEEARAAARRRALDEYEEALRLSSPTELVNPFAIHLNAGVLAARLGEPQRALDHARAALRLAPEGERASVQTLLRELETGSAQAR